MRPFEKAQPSKLTKNKVRNRKRISAILTETLVKKALEQEQKAVKEKKPKGLKNKKLLSSKRASPSNSKMSKALTCQPVKNKRNSKIKDDIEDDVLCLSCFKPF